MADIADVEAAIVSSVTACLYPQGLSQSSVVGTLCRVYRGWPNSATLNADLNKNIVNITVVSDAETGRTTTRYLPEWAFTPASPGTIVATTSTSITIAGSPQVGDVVGCLIDGLTYVYRVQSGDAAGLIAANISLLIRKDRPVLVAGPKIELPGAASVVARVVADGQSAFESRRQEKDIRVICWCPSPTVRDAVAAAIDSALNDTPFLVLSDSTNARIIYRNTASYDQAQNALLYRRDLVYVAEYPSVTVAALPSMIFGAAAINGSTKIG